MDNYLPRGEHEEFAKRMEEEHRRQNRRLEELETVSKQNNKLLISVEKLALSMEKMQEEQKEQGERLEALEARDGENWRKAGGYVMSVVIGAVVGYVMKQIGF